MFDCRWYQMKTERGLTSQHSHSAAGCPFIGLTFERRKLAIATVGLRFRARAVTKEENNTSVEN